MSRKHDLQAGGAESKSMAFPAAACYTAAMQKILSICLFCALLWLAPAALAAQNCYTPAEVEAEQALRIHSELMVIGLTCNRAQGGQPYARYQQFTRKHESLLSGYESDLIRHYRAEGDKNPEKHLHNLRTQLANGISRHAANMPTPEFCDRFAPRLSRALAMSPAQLRQWAQHTWADTPTTRPVCAKAAG